MTNSVSGAGPAATLTGWRGNSEYFRFRELEGFQPSAVADVLRGTVLGVMLHAAIPAELCAAIAARFWASRSIKRRGGEAPVRYVGACAYQQTTADYLRECAAIGPALEEILGPDDPARAFYRGLRDALGRQGITVRSARHGAREACPVVIRSWSGQGDFALDPHEDRSQCREPRQSDFEIRRVLGFEVCRLNICVANGAGGMLRVWNIKPDHESKHRYGTSFGGTPYLPGSLAGIDMLRLTVRPGDIYVFNGSHVHAIERPGDDTRRTTLSGLLGFIDDSTVVWWT